MFSVPVDLLRCAELPVPVGYFYYEFFFFFFFGGGFESACKKCSRLVVGLREQINAFFKAVVLGACYDTEVHHFFFSFCARFLNLGA